MMCGSLMVLRWIVLVSAVSQFVGTALIVWGLRAQAAIVSEHRRVFLLGALLLLGGLALQVVVALL